MAQIEFTFQSVKISIQCNLEEKMKDIILKFLIKLDKKNEDFFFLYNGNTFNQDLTFNEIANEFDKNRKQMSIIVNDKKNVEEKTLQCKKSKYIICPQCYENSRIAIDNNNISLYDCKNGHKKENIPFNAFEKTQYIDETKIKCNKCQRVNKSETYGKNFFICLSCKMNLCPLCRESHDKSHYVINYEEKYFICNTHFDIYFSYCCDCKKDICTICQKGHQKHNTIIYGNILPDINELEKELNKTEKIINEFKNNIMEKINKLNILMDNLDRYFNIYKDLLINFDIRKRNYCIIQNVNDIIFYNNKGELSIFI